MRMERVVMISALKHDMKSRLANPKHCSPVMIYRKLRSMSHCPTSEAGSRGSGQSGGGMRGGSVFNPRPTFTAAWLTVTLLTAVAAAIFGNPANPLAPPFNDAALAERDTAPGREGLLTGIVGGETLPCSAAVLPTCAKAASRPCNMLSACANVKELLDPRLPGPTGGGDTVGGGESGRMDVRSTEDRREDEVGRSMDDTDALSV
jgi:hypothetical protein